MIVKTKANATILGGSAFAFEKRVTSVKKIKLNGLDGREFTIVNDKGLFGKGRMLVDPKRPSLYQAFVITQNRQQLDSPLVLGFLDSFNIVKK